MIFGVDTPGRRTRVDYSGSIFQYSPVAAGRSEWGYNDRNEVTSSANYTSGGQNMTARNRAYAYDPIGNRQSLNEGTAPAMQYYCTNEVNQYETRDDTQTCPPSAPVAETFGHDEDGNLTADMNFNYAWDAENRLIAVQTRLELGTNPTGPDANDKRLEFKYDYRGRRVEKTYQVYNGSAWVTQTGFPQRFVYDGWNVVLTLNSSGTVTARYTWGLDISGSLHGAGGIGGLLAAKVGSSNYWYFYDGNGNVVQAFTPPGGFTILSAPPDGVVAHYEYDPYGNVVTTISGSYSSNPFRFSTKWCDYELGTGKELYYYGYRYYSTRLGRWLSRDPIGERGGRNIYVMCLNQPLALFDPIGAQLGGTPPPELEPKDPKCPSCQALLEKYCPKGDCSKSADWSIRDTIQSIISHPQKSGIKCRHPLVLCHDCPHDFYGPIGGFSMGSSSGRNSVAVICSNNLTSEHGFVESLRHELWHAWQHCVEEDSGPSDCSECLSREMEAHYYSRSCHPGGKLNPYGQSSICACVARHAAGSCSKQCGLQTMADLESAAEYAETLCNLVLPMDGWTLP